MTEVGQVCPALVTCDDAFVKGRNGHATASSLIPILYLGVGNFYLTNSKKLQIGIGIDKFSVNNSEELQIGKF